MRNKLNLKEGEVQRILSLHKTAVIKEHKISSLNEELLMEKTYGVNLKKRLGWNSGGLKSKDKITKIKVKSFNKDMVEADVTFGDGGKIDVSFDCKKPDIMVIGGDGQMTGSEYRTDEKFKNLIKWYCAGKPKKDRDNESGTSNDSVVGGSEYKQKKDQLLTPIPGGKVIQQFTLFGKGTTIWKKTKKGAITTKDFNSGTYKIGFLCDGYKDYDFIYGKKWFKNKELGSILKKQFCGKEIETEKQNEKQNEKENEKQNEKNTFLAAGTSGTKYSFDFETIMKAIDDTGKCPRSGTSDQAGTSGTSGVQGTQGTSGVGAPVVIQKPTVTKDDFYQWTMD